MAEIERCRPYFIGLLGERYGWVPDEIHPELIDDQPWLEEHRGKSVTDLEIQHGVLEDAAMDGVAFFYFRDPETSKQVEAELANDPGYQLEPESARAKLEHLKQRIEDSDAPLREDYPDAVIRDAVSNQIGSDEIPSDPQKVIEVFPLWLAKAAAKGRFILVLDALNQLEDRDNAPDLGWLPIFFPTKANCRFQPMLEFRVDDSLATPWRK